MTESLRILLIEDSPSDATLAGEDLQAADGVRLDMTWARTLGHAVRRLESDERFDCVLLDLSLPDADGLDALPELSVRGAGTAVVVLCGVEMEELALAAVEHGAQDYVVKGETTRSALARTVRTAVRRARAGTPAPGPCPVTPEPAAPRPAARLEAVPATAHVDADAPPGPAAAAPPSPGAPVRVFLCDDVAALRQLLRAYLEEEPGLDVVGEAADGAGLAAAVSEARADVVLLDLSMPGVDGLEAIAALRADQPGLGIIVLSGFEQGRMEAQALALGADRYLEKRAGMAQVRRTVLEVSGARRPSAGWTAAREAS